MKKVLITDRVHEHLIKSLESQGFHVDYLPQMMYREFLAVVSNYAGVVINSKITMDKNAMDKASKLNFIARLGSGLDIIDLPYAREKDIQVYSSPEGNRNAVAEHAVGMLLALCNNLVKADREVREMKWKREENRGIELVGRTIGIIGFGNNGSAFAKKWQGWDVHVLAYDKYKQDYAEEYPWVEECSLEKIQQEADIISLHIPLTEETHHLINSRFIENCHKSIILINCARGKNVLTKEILPYLENGEMRGACLDVFENEKPESFTKEEENLYKRLYSRDNVILSPHIAGWTDSSFYKIAATLATKIAKNL